MKQLTIPASEARERLSELMENAQTSGRIAITKHGEAKVFLISVRELQALEETLAILDNEELMKGIREGLDDIRLGRVRGSREVFAELDAEFEE